MKRANNDGEGRGGGGKRYREAGGGYDEALAAGKFELRLLIPTKAAGAVIGKGGEYIKAVREKVRKMSQAPFYSLTHTHPPWSIGYLSPPPSRHPAPKLGDCRQWVGDHSQLTIAPPPHPLCVR